MKQKLVDKPQLVTVCCRCGTFWEDEFEIDANIFNDVYLECATRGTEKRKRVPGFTVSAFIECWKKEDVADPNKHLCYNTYFVLVNAGMHEKAEMLREKFYKIHKIDVQKESLKPTEETTNGKQTTAASGSIH